ncbi:hypothetical protein NC652_021836 [Populus alba x Populus x berolinensis]|nr:hypothetical protein NC652_021836 [Populus alba x Populus x berolinensis]
MTEERVATLAVACSRCSAGKIMSSRFPYCLVLLLRMWLSVVACSEEDDSRLGGGGSFLKRGESWCKGSLCFLHGTVLLEFPSDTAYGNTVRRPEETLEEDLNSQIPTP